MGMLFFCVIFANLPDIDFISIAVPSFSQEVISLPVIKLSWENHHGTTHSLGFVVLIMLAVMLVVRIFQRDWKQWGIISGLCMASHILMDSLIVKKGLMLFYPLSTHRIIIATGFPFGYSPEMGFVSFVIMSAVEEMVILGGILFVVWRIIK